MDPDPSSSFYSLPFLIFLFTLNAVFVAVEYALLSCNPRQLRSEQDNRNGSSDASIWLLSHLELSVASIQLAISACSILIGWVGIHYLYPFFVEFLGVLGFLSETGGILETSMPFSIALAAVVLICAHVVISELLVKAIATSFPLATLRALSMFVRIFTLLTYPASMTVYWFTSFLLKPFRLTIRHADRDNLSVEELKKLFSSVPSDSDIGSDQARMIRGVVGFSETVAREVMTPRTDLVTVKIGSSLESITKVIIDSGHSRIPVRGERVDDIMGILLARDLIPYFGNKEGRDSKNFDMLKVMRKAYFIPGTKAIDELLNEFRRRSLHMAIILDEHGGVDGVVTLEDILEEIVGDIYDESDEPEQLITKEECGDCIVDGGVLVADINDRFELSIPEGEYDTIAGFIFTCLGRMPRKDDVIIVNHDIEGHLRVNGSDVYDRNTEDFAADEDLEPISHGVKLLAERVEGNRIERVRLQFINHICPELDESEGLDIASQEEQEVA